MTRRHDNDEERLRELVTDAAAGVEPNDRLAAITARTRGRARTRRSTMRNRTLAVAGAVVGTAAVIAVAAWAGGAFSPSPDQPVPVADDSTSSAPTPGSSTASSPTAPTSTTGDSPTADSTPEPEPEPYDSATATPYSGGPRAAGIYFVGDGPDGPRLYREFQEVPSHQPGAALTISLQGHAQDPDYRSAWTGIVDRVADVRTGERIHVVFPAGAGDLRDRPDGMSGHEARVAVQQLVRTVQAYAGERVGVTFAVDGREQPLPTLLGVPANGDDPGVFVAARGLKVLSHMSITNPAEGTTVTDGTLEANGRASSFEANVVWQIRRNGSVVKEGFTTAEGWMGHLYPWSTEIDVSGLEPGTYTLRVSTSDPSGGREGPGPHTDTRTFHIQ